MLLSLNMISYAGVQEDEALFSVPFYSALPREYKIRTSHHDIPLMVMSYVGALKTWIYWPLIHWFGSSVWTVRLPVILAGTITVFLFYHLIRGFGGAHAAFAALAGALVLATDPIFLLTNTYDWGPVALEHLLLMTACLLLYRFWTRPSQIRYLAFGFGCFGLALWNKALFIWALSGLTIATVSILWRDIRPLLTLRNGAIGAGCFLAGALPFVIFNLRAANATLNENAHLDLQHLPQKWLQLERAFDGSSLWEFMVDEDTDPPVKDPPSWRGRLAEWVWKHTGEHRETRFFTVFGLILACGPLWWRSSAARFSLVFLIVAWSMMALTRNAGGAAHHDILLWPFPVLFAISAVARIPWPWARVACAAGLVTMNLLVVSQYVFQFERDGATENFTDALFALGQALPENRTVYVIDWGINTTSQLSRQGHLDMHYVAGAISNPGADASDRMRAMLADRDAVFVDHVPSREAFPGVGANLDKFAASAGYRRELVRTVTDSNRRPVFEIYRFQPAS